MCLPALLALGPAAAAAGGATAAAATAATAGGFAATLANLGTMASVGGSLVSGVMGLQQGRQQAAALEHQAQEERRIGTTEATRIRQDFRRQIGQQAVELAGRGIRLDSPSAIYLAEEGGREMAFASDSAAAGRNARGAELSAAARSSRAMGIQSLLRGGFSAGETLLTAAPTLWPGLRG